ncbi:hypothetical protein WMZ97_10825 [Lentibacillus sp. N15]|uniref:hypothetical protein n=1 Tax=Lentibacillus songyuanensis TaxID=3136161 RepID=UPI0031B9CD11
MFGESSGVTFQNPNFTQLADGYGIRNGKANSLIEFADIMIDALQSVGEITIIDVLLPQ